MKLNNEIIFLLYKEFVENFKDAKYECDTDQLLDFREYCGSRLIQLEKLLLNIDRNLQSDIME